jgi:hypothetical protein
MFGTIRSSVEWNGAPGAPRLSVRRRRDDDRRQVLIPAPRLNEAYHTRPQGARIEVLYGDLMQALQNLRLLDAVEGLHHFGSELVEIRVLIPAPVGSLRTIGSAS